MSIILENDIFRLTLSDTAIAESLILKSNGEECISAGNELPFFTLTMERPYNNEVKLAHPNKRTAFAADRISYSDGKLTVGFEEIAFEALIGVKIAERYVSFTLENIIALPDAYGLGVLMIDPPPIYELRMVQLPVKPREHFGEWLNVMWDEKAAVNVLACDPYPRIDSEKRKDHRILFGEALRDVKLIGTTVGLIVSDKDSLLDAVNDIEYDFDLPKGVESRRSGRLNRTYIRSRQFLPENIDELVGYAKKCGIRDAVVYYSCLAADDPGLNYNRCSDYVIRDEFKDGLAGVKDMVDRFKAEGITVGFHFLHTHVGLATSFVKGSADYRLNTTKKFRLSRPLTESDAEVYVEEDPTGSAMHEKCRILAFMGELISYEGFTTERPYKFYGCKRGVYDTSVRTHERGEWGGIIDISEFAANSAYVDQRTSLEDEIADRIAKIWECGFEFAYYDGSEGTEPPFEINVPLAQYRIYQRLNPKPIYCEGAAKAHFSWHMLSGANAFDVWDAHEFKQKIIEHPYREAKLMANDFTRVNFGWWLIDRHTRADITEFGTSKAAAFDCPGSVVVIFEFFRNHPRINDILEVLRRWEDVRENGFLTPERKEMLKDTDTEFTLLINESGDYELVPYFEVKGTPENVYAFTFRRGDKSCAVIWNNVSDSKLSVKLDGAFTYKDELAGAEVAFESDGDSVILPIAGKRYLCADMPVEALRAALAEAKSVNI